MDFLTKLRKQIRSYLFIILVVENAVILTAYALLPPIHFLTPNQMIGALATAGVVAAFFLARVASDYTMQPITKIWQAIQHVSPHGENQPAPNLQKRQLGFELVSTLVNHIYQFASVVDNVEKTTADNTSQNKLQGNFIANALPLALLVLDKDQNVVFLNDAASKYLGQSLQDAAGKHVGSVLDMSFSSNQTFETWLADVKTSTVTANNTWERVRVGLPGQTKSLQFDLAAHYSKDNSLGYETLLVLFDHSAMYSQDDQAMSFVALSVHELRTPLTLLRGYIEVFDEELGPNLNTELKAFMKKMDASAQQLAAFVDNILNVAKIEDNQLTLQLHEENWKNVIDTVVSDLSLRASVRGLAIKTDIAADLPTVGVDRYSIYEVLANLIDNAIKYSGTTKEIYVTAALNGSGLVETSVKDFGLGIDASILPHIFDKFYRNHRNRAQIGGTGLGLYLSKSIVDAHDGEIWVRSKVNEGSTFTFTLHPYAELAQAGKTGDNSGITRGAHGWIKNHSLYRD